MTETTETSTAAGRARVDLVIGGMTCASCAARIEKRLNKIDGVEASVNYATEKATVAFPDTMATDDLVAAVERAGYTASVPRPKPESTDDDREPDGDELRSLRSRLLVSLVLSVPVIALAMFSALQFTY